MPMRLRMVQEYHRFFLVSMRKRTFKASLSIPATVAQVRRLKAPGSVPTLAPADQDRFLGSGGQFFTLSMR